jgi:diguanylate cyclase (GGDEF)-like protein
MLTFRFALLATGVSVAALPLTAVAATSDTATADPAEVSRLAAAAIDVLEQEHQLVVEFGDTTPGTELADIDAQGAALLGELDALDVQLTQAARTALDTLPADGEGFLPDTIVYETALDDLARVVATPEAALPPSSSGNGPALGLLAVAALSLLVLGAAALGNTLRRRESDEELAALAWSDGLTGLANRRRLDHDVATHDLSDESVAVVMIDIDHFKSVNDNFGHHEGDEVLRQIAAMLAEEVRHDDVVYRYGGEEFCVLLPGATHEDAVGVGDRIVAAARRILLPDGSHLTISAGVAHGDAVPASTSCASADLALRAAKRAGCDQAVDAATLELATT